MPHYNNTQTQILAGDCALFKEKRSSRVLQPVKIKNIEFLADNTCKIHFSSLQIAYTEVWNTDLELYYFQSEADDLAYFYLEYLKFIKSKADQQNRDAMFAYAALSKFWSFHGRANPQKAMAEAIHYFDLASQLGDAEASYELANMYQQITNPDYAQFFATNRESNIQHYLQKSAEQGHKIGQYQLAYFYEYAEHGFIQDYEKSVYWYQQSADQNYPQALNNLGDKYEKARGVKRDYQKAVMYYEKSAEYGIKEAIYNLGRLYLRGLGVPKDEIKGQDLLEQAAKQYYQPAIRKLKNLDKKP